MIRLLIFQILLLLILASNHAWAESDPKLRSMARVLRGESSILWRKVSLPVVDKTGTVASVIYGARGFGYFETLEFKDLRTEADSIEIELIVPTYSAPIEFYVRDVDGSQILAATIQFQPPFTSGFLGLSGNTAGTLSKNFYLLTGALRFTNPDQSASEMHFPYIMNKWGEVIWLHIPKRIFEYHPVFKKIAPGEFGLLHYRKESHFQILTLQGKIKKLVNPKEADTPYVIHHDFQVAADQKSMITLGHIVKKVRHFNRINPFEKSFDRWFADLKIFLNDSITYLGSSVIQVDLEANQATTLWNPFDHFNPLDIQQTYRPVELLSPDLSPSEFQRLKERGSVWSYWKTRADIDWMHGNSLDCHEKHGCLLSVRAWDKILLLSNDFKEVMGVIGSDPSDSIRIPTPGFAAQHHATWTPEETVLLFDNAANLTMRSASPPPHPGIMELDIKTPKAPKVLRNIRPNSPVKSYSRGSAEFLNNGHRQGYFPQEEGTMDFLLEFDEKDTVVGALNISHEQGWSGYRAEGHNTLGKEIFLQPKK